MSSDTIHSGAGGGGADEGVGEDNGMKAGSRKPNVGRRRIKTVFTMNSSGSLKSSNVYIDESGKEISNVEEGVVDGRKMESGENGEKEGEALAVKTEPPKKVSNKKQYSSKLSNLLYKSLLSETEIGEDTKITDASTMQNLLTNESQITKEKLPWIRLSKSQKAKLLCDFAYMYAAENDLNDKESEELKVYLLDCLHRKRFAKAKDIKYNRDSEYIEDIPGLTIQTTTHKTSVVSSSSIVVDAAAASSTLHSSQSAQPTISRKFTLKREDTIKNSTLKNLAPKKHKESLNLLSAIPKTEN